MRPAQYTTTCASCGEDIEPGELIDTVELLAGIEGWAHVECAGGTLW